MINAIFANQLIPVFTLMLTIDIFLSYGLIRDVLAVLTLTPEQMKAKDDPLFYARSISFIFGNSGYVTMHLLLKIPVAHIGHTTRVEAENTRVIIAKFMNDFLPHQQIRFELCSALIQFQSRNTTLRNFFFTIDWGVLLSVSKMNLK